MKNSSLKHTGQMNWGQGNDIQILEVVSCDHAEKLRSVISMVRNMAKGGNLWHTR